MVKQIKSRDGIFFRVNRSGNYDNVCFSDLEEIEMREVMQRKDMNWMKSLIAALIDNAFIAPQNDNSIRRLTRGEIEDLRNYAISLGNEIYNCE